MVAGVAADAEAGLSDEPLSARRGRPPIPANREAILSATREVIARAGYSALTLEEVASSSVAMAKSVSSWSGTP